MEMKCSDGNFTDNFTGLIGQGNTQKTDTIRIITLSKDLANKNCDYAHSHSHPPQHQPHTSKRTIKNNENQQSVTSIGSPAQELIPVFQCGQRVPLTGLPALNRSTLIKKSGLKSQSSIVCVTSQSRFKCPSCPRQIEAVEQSFDPTWKK